MKGGLTIIKRTYQNIILLIVVVLLIILVSIQLGTYSTITTEYKASVTTVNSSNALDTEYATLETKLDFNSRKDIKNKLVEVLNNDTKVKVLNFSEVANQADTAQKSAASGKAALSSKDSSASNLVSYTFTLSGTGEDVLSSVTDLLSVSNYSNVVKVSLQADNMAAIYKMIPANATMCDFVKAYKGVIPAIESSNKGVVATVTIQYLVR